MKDRETTLIILCDGIRKGMTRRIACEYAGISHVTLANWIKETPSIDTMLNKAKAEWAARLLPKAEDKEPWKMLKSAYRGEYQDDPQTAIQINMERPLIMVPSETLLETVKLLQAKKKELEAANDGTTVDAVANSGK